MNIMLLRLMIIVLALPLSLIIVSALLLALIAAIFIRFIFQSVADRRTR